MISISELKDIAVAFSALSATYIAYQGLSTWKDELKGKSEYQISKDVLRAVYKVREAFKHVRNPVIYQYEYPEDMTSSSGHLKSEHIFEGNAHVYEQRWKVLHKAFVELEECFLEALVVWGSDYQDTIAPLRLCRGEVQMAIQHLLSKYRNPHEADWMNAEERKRQRAVIYYGGKESKYDTFTPEIDLAVQKFEKWFRNS